MDDRFRAISHDARHGEVKSLIREDIERRRFDGWSMAYRSLDDVDVAREEGFSPFLSGTMDFPPEFDATSAAWLLKWFATASCTTADPAARRRPRARCSDGLAGHRLARMTVRRRASTATTPATARATRPSVPIRSENDARIPPPMSAPPPSSTVRKSDQTASASPAKPTASSAVAVVRSARASSPCLSLPRGTAR